MCRDSVQHLWWLQLHINMNGDQSCHETESEWKKTFHFINTMKLSPWALFYLSHCLILIFCFHCLWVLLLTEGRKQDLFTPMVVLAANLQSARKYMWERCGEWVFQLGGGSFYHVWKNLSNFLALGEKDHTGHWGLYLSSQPCKKNNVLTCQNMIKRNLKIIYKNQTNVSNFWKMSYSHLSTLTKGTITLEEM